MLALAAAHVPVGSIACDHCGSAFRPAALAAHVACPYCQFQQPLDQRRLLQLQGYEERVGDELLGAEQHAQQLATYHKWYGKTDALPNYTAQFFLTFAACALISALVGVVLALLEVIEWMLLPSVILMGGFGCASVIYYAGMIARGFSRAPVDRSALGAVAVLCPNCGAPGELTPGDALDTCRHCHAALVPDVAAMRLGEAAARAARRRVAMAKYRKERNTFGQIYRSSAGQYVHLFVMVPFGLMLALPTLMITGEVITGARGVPPFGPLLLLWGMSFALWGAIIGSIWWRYARHAKIAAPIAQLCARLGGRSGRGTAPLVTWLNAYWCGPFPIQQLYLGPYHHLVELAYSGYPMLVDYNPSTSEHMVGRFQVLLAADIPGVQFSPAEYSVQPSPQVPWPRLSPAAQAALREVQQLRFGVRLSEAGLLAEADPALLKECKKHPERLLLVEAVGPRLVQLAAQMGASPVRSVD